MKQLALALAFGVGVSTIATASGHALLAGTFATSDSDVDATGHGLRGSHKPVSTEDLRGLASKMSTFAIPHVVDPNKWLQECAYYIMKVDWANNNPWEGNVDSEWMNADYFYKDLPSGLCSMKMESAFGMEWNYTMYEPLKELFEGIDPESDELSSIDISAVEGIIPTPLTIPSKIAFPMTAKDVVEVVKFSKENGLQVSVKNSGHNYAGQSDVEGSFQLNMRNFPKYSKTDVVVCTDETATEPLVGAPCKLALARGKSAVVRVSGSEGNDSIYSSVHNWNHAVPREKRYQVSGGGEGAVGAGGGYMMGSGLGMGVNDRKWGICVDQVLVLEMVLPSGEHVKFGPSEWEEVDGYLYPQTRAVKGLCNKNINHLESEFEWGECESGVPFEDLWFAVRGGGGGTWGVVIISSALKADCEEAGNCEDVEASLNESWIDFNIDFMFGPITDENSESASCGANGIPSSKEVPTFFDGGAPDLHLNCIGESATQQYIEGWKNYVAKSSDRLCGVNITLAQDLLVMSAMGDVFGIPSVTTWGDIEVTLPAVGTHKDTAAEPDSFMKAPAGVAFSVKSAALFSGYDYNLLVPPSLLLKKDDMAREIVRQAGGSHYWGANSASASDGMDSMSWAFRSTVLGYQTGGHNNLGYDEDEWLEMVQKAVVEHLKKSADYIEGEFPGFQELNHVQGNTALPLKDDWSKICLKENTADERREKCMSAQESIWGTANLKRLESIKEAIDPEGMFSVRYGIGNDWVMDWHEKGISAPTSFDL
ncbi:hypothetical protein ACHAWF_008427 [Thalassiosira exigua]